MPNSEGRFVVPLPKKPDAGAIGESRTQAVRRRFKALERSLTHKGQFSEFDTVMQEYLHLGHAEKVPSKDMEKDFLLRKWNSNDVSVLQDVAPELRECRDVHSIADTNYYTKTLGLEWNTVTDQFHLTVSDLPATEVVTKRILVCDIAKVFDVLGWFSPATIRVKILLQRLWEQRVD